MQGTYRNTILKQAMCVNGTSITPRGILAFSEKKDALILFQFLELAHVNGEKLFQFLRVFIAHARVWQEALTKGDVPQLEKEAIS